MPANAPNSITSPEPCLNCSRHLSWNLKRSRCDGRITPVRTRRPRNPVAARNLSFQTEESRRPTGPTNAGQSHNFDSHSGQTSCTAFWSDHVSWGDRRGGLGAGHRSCPTNPAIRGSDGGRSGDGHQRTGSGPFAIGADPPAQSVGRVPVHKSDVTALGGGQKPANVAAVAICGRPTAGHSVLIFGTG
ncbi:hypothetical protein RUA8715_01830 [Ruegeria arenilitoris]|uniref:Uncharacterized protein n=1 Tax=Ruegeria arenilitoris TaxID=1173585 RepID=A0A238KDL9_9RHOB|nr:hypothetical protein RUA8715_01830 [Ruegeria arenilitoris]